MGKYAKDIEDMINSIPIEKIKKENEKQSNKTKEMYKKFKEYYKKGKCSFCGNDLKIFSKGRPCLHYLLRRTKNFKNKNFKDIYDIKSYFNIATYLRWVANEEGYMLNINDLEEEKGNKKKFEYTIKWKNIEWTFSCDENDFLGHNGINSNFPHYHFQMKIDGRIFIKFGQHHIPFTENDLFNFDLIENNKVEFGWGGGEGMGSFFDKLSQVPENELDDILKEFIHTEDEKLAQIRTETIITGNMEGDDLSELFKKSKETGKTMNTLLKEKYPNHKIQTIISPNDTIVDIAKRKGGR